MASQSRTISKPGNLKSMLVAAGLILIFLTSIFIPEIISYTEGLVGVKNPQQEEPRASLKAKYSPLSGISNSLNSQQSLPKIRDDKATIEQIRTGNFDIVLQQAENTSVAIAKGLDPSKAGSRYALFNFINGIKFIRSGQSVMSQAEAAHYLQDLKIKAGAALEQDGVSKNTIEQWRTVSLDTTRVLDAQVPQAKYASIRGRSGQGLPSPYKIRILQAVSLPNGVPLRVNGKIYVGSQRDLPEILVYRNGEFSQKASFGATIEGWFPFEFTGRKITGNYHIVVKDKNSSIKSRKYNFASRLIPAGNGVYYATYSDSDQDGGWLRQF